MLVVGGVSLPTKPGVASVRPAARPSGMCVAGCGLQDQAVQIERSGRHTATPKTGQVCGDARQWQKHGGWPRGLGSVFTCGARGVAAIDSGFAGFVEIVSTQCIVSSITQSSVRAAVERNVVLNAVLRRVGVCRVLPP